MTPEEKSLLERTYKLAEENNIILHSIRRSNRFSAAMRIVYWVIIIGLSVGAYYLIQPYLQTVMGLYGQATSILGGKQNSINSLQDLLK